MRKARAGGKSEIGDVGKNAKVGSSFPTGGRLLSVSTGKTSAPPTYKTARAYKSSTTFGVVWVPRRKLNKYYKDSVYNSHKNDRSYDRSPSMYNYMSGDSSNTQTLKQKDDESELLFPERIGHTSTATSTSVEAAIASDLPPDIITKDPDEKNELVNLDKEDNKDAAGDIDSCKKKDDTALLIADKENNTQSLTENIQKDEKEKLGDNVDSVFLRSPPPHKTRSAASTPEEEDCGIKCLYYTMQCCDCILM